LLGNTGLNTRIEHALGRRCSLRDRLANVVTRHGMQQCSDSAGHGRVMTRRWLIGTPVMGFRAPNNPYRIGLAQVALFDMALVVEGGGGHGRLDLLGNDGETGINIANCRGNPV
jgi:hypothetical protein